MISVQCLGSLIKTSIAINLVKLKDNKNLIFQHGNDLVFTDCDKVEDINKAIIDKLKRDFARIIKDLEFYVNGSIFPHYEGGETDEIEDDYIIQID